MNRLTRNLRTFLVVWLGQTGSNLGSRMTAFALTLWAWDLTQQATGLALVGFFTQIPQLLLTPLAGVMVDRWNRKWLMMVGDTVAGLSTIVLLWLYASDHLQIWHLYCAGAIKGAFVQIQQLAYTTSMTLMVPQRHYSRAISLNLLSGYGANIIGPALAGTLYPFIGLIGIFLVDLSTFAIAILTVCRATIPQPEAPKTTAAWHQDFAVGFRYLAQRPGMIGILVTATLFQLMNGMANAIHSPMILARSGGSAYTLAAVSATAGIGGVMGAILITTWGGPNPRIYGVLLGMVGAGIGKLGVGLGRNLFFWLPMQFCSSFNFPMMGSSGNAIWLSTVPPDLQGRVFSISVLIKGVMSPLGRLLVGPLADRVFEPAMMPGGSLTPLFGPYFGTGRGAGMGVLYGLAAIAMMLIGLGGFLYRPLRTVETKLSQHS
ncbi:MAG: MFS transporter [Leptolyngbyaceae cyanobacterium]